MALPVDQVIREQQFLAANPEWSIHAHDRGSRFIAESNRGSNHHVVAASSMARAPPTLPQPTNEMGLRRHSTKVQSMAFFSTAG
jgi:hypothetical protein